MASCTDQYPKPWTRPTHRVGTIGAVFTGVTPDRDKQETGERHKRAKKPRVLVVDDDPMVRDAVIRVLERMPVETVEAVHTDDALDILQRERFNLIVTDWKMPGGGGARLIEELIGTVPPLPPIILLTGSAADVHGMGWKGWRAINAMFEKPFSLRELRSEVRKILDIRNGNGHD